MTETKTTMQVLKHGIPQAVQRDMKSYHSRIKLLTIPCIILIYSGFSNTTFTNT